LLCTQKHVCKLLQAWVWLHLIIPVTLMSRLLWNGLCYFQCRNLTFFQDVLITKYLLNLHFSISKMCFYCLEAIICTCKFKYFIMASSNGLLCTQKHVCKLLQAWVWLHLIIPVTLMSRLLWNGLCYFQCRNLTFFQDVLITKYLLNLDFSISKMCFLLPGVPIKGTKNMNFRITLFHKRNVLVEHDELLRGASFACHT